MPDLIRLLHGNPRGIKKLVMEFREYWKLKSTGENDPESVSEMEIDSPSTSHKEIMNGGPSLSESALPQTVTNTPDHSSYAISKRQLEKNIMSIAAREKRQDKEKKCWYVHQMVLQKYGLEELKPADVWEYVTGLKNAGRHLQMPKRGCQSQSIAKYTCHVSPEAVLKTIVPEKSEQKTPKSHKGILNFVQKRSPSSLEGNARSAVLNQATVRLPTSPLTLTSADSPSTLNGQRLVKHFSDNEQKMVIQNRVHEDQKAETECIVLE